MPPKKSSEKKVAPRKVIQKKKLTSTDPSNFHSGDILKIVKKTTALCQKYYGRKGIVTGYKQKKIQLLFVCGDEAKSEFFNPDCCKLLSESEKNKFWSDFDVNIVMARMTQNVPLL